MSVKRLLALLLVLCGLSAAQNINPTQIRGTAVTSVSSTVSGLTLTKSGSAVTLAGAVSAANGVPTGGTQYQYLAKTSGTDYATAWTQNLIELADDTFGNTTAPDSYPRGVSIMYGSGSGGGNSDPFPYYGNLLTYNYGPAGDNSVYQQLVQVTSGNAGEYPRLIERSRLVNANSWTAWLDVTAASIPSGTAQTAWTTLTVGAAPTWQPVLLASRLGAASGVASLDSGGKVLVAQESDSALANISRTLYGDGHDGAQLMDGTATASCASKSGSVYTLTKDCYATSFTLTAAATLKSGYRIFVNGTATINGSVLNNGNAASGATAGTGGGGGYFTGAGTGGAGGANAAGTAGTGTAYALASSGGVGGTNATAGGAAGVATAVAAGVGGLDMFTIQPVMTTLWYRASINAFGLVTGGGGGGGGGANATSSTGGGGGGGGSGFWMAAKTFASATGTINVSGGAGGTAPTGNAAGGGGGGGGWVMLIADNLTATYWTQPSTTVTVAGVTLNVLGGVAGANVGTGTTTSAAAGVNGRYLVVNPRY